MAGLNLNQLQNSGGISYDFIGPGYNTTQNAYNANNYVKNVQSGAIQHNQTGTYAPPAPAGQTLGASTGPSSPAVWSGWGQTFANEADYRAEQARQEQAQNEQYINSIYQPQMDYLGQLESTYRDQLPGYQAEVQQNYDTNKQILGTTLANTQTDISNQETAGTRAKEDALSKARRIFNEQQIGSQQRFGGSSSAGQAANELLARNLQTEQGLTNRNYMDFTQKIGQLRQQAQQKFDDSMLQIEQQKQTALTNIQREFDQKLLEIANNKTQVSAAKAQARLQALMDLRNKTFAIQQQTQQFQQAISQQKAAAETSLASYAQNASGYAQGASQGFNTLSSGLTSVGNPMAVNYGANQATTNPYVGYAQTGKREDMYA